MTQARKTWLERLAHDLRASDCARAEFRSTLAGLASLIRLKESAA